MAWVLLLYYHLIREGGVTHDQTVYVDPTDFDPFECLEAEVADELRGDIDQDLIREGAVVFLLCELNDVVTDYENDYLKQPFTQKILRALTSSAAVAAIPESREIADGVSKGEEVLDYNVLQSLLEGVFNKYVVRTYTSTACGRKA